jgi:hypothetical protein
MNLTAHPLSVAAELAWKGDLYRGANLAAQHHRPRRRLHWPKWPERRGGSGRTEPAQPAGTPRQVPRPA